MTIRAGELRDQVVLQYSNGTRDAVGGVSTAWATLDTVWAKIEEGTGLETNSDSSPVVAPRGAIVIRRNPLLNAAARGSAVRVSFDPGNSEKVRIYDVLSIQDDRMHRDAQVLTVREVY